jgi:hypothetical protein
MAKRHITDNSGHPLTTDDGSYVVIYAEIDPADLKFSTPRSPMLQRGSKRFTRHGPRSTPGFTGPYVSIE